MAKRREQQDDRPAGLTHNPFAALRGGAPPPPSAPREAAADPESRAPEARGPLTVRREKKGRGGKTVTRVEGLAPGMADRLAGELKRALGCGASVEDGDVLLQGAQTERAAAWLRERLGVRVTVGN